MVKNLIKDEKPNTFNFQTSDTFEDAVNAKVNCSTNSSTNYQGNNYHSNNFPNRAFFVTFQSFEMSVFYTLAPSCGPKLYRFEMD